MSDRRKQSNHPNSQKSDDQKTVRRKISKLIETIDDACNRLNNVSKKTSGQQRSSVVTIRNTLLRHREKLINASNENVENINQYFQDILQVISLEIERAFKELQRACGDKDDKIFPSWITKDFQ
ncbi:hypothetical protein O3M35_005252 [Rhynocoris fuscipes]|uniref:Uncharacterized protein n=1 Tax=Rhynocoris fuscipes TaxID=488301 RepID=A0AAW1DIY6_9HEMI